MDTLEKAKLTASMRHIARLLKSGIPIYNSTVPDMGNKTLPQLNKYQYKKITITYAWHGQS